MKSNVPKVYEVAVAFNNFPDEHLVVEYSAYEALKTKLDKARDALKFYDSMSAPGGLASKTLEEIGHDQRQTLLNETVRNYSR